jgi:hypothetical protein
MIVIAFILIILPIKQEENNIYRRAKNILKDRKALKTMCYNNENTFRIRITEMLLDMARKWAGGGGRERERKIE